MTAPTDRTNDPSLRSWVEAANRDGADFPVQNLPFGVVRPRGSDGPGQVAVAIGDRALLVPELLDAKLLAGDAARAAEACRGDSLNELMGLGPAASGALRQRLSELLLAGEGALAGDAARVERALLPLDAVEPLLPARVGDYTDFYASVHHATNVGSMFRPDNPLLPNYKYIPVGYHGRASSVVASGHEVVRPQGQTKADDAAAPTYGPSRLLDYELEVGFFVGQGNALGQPVDIASAGDHIFGFCLVNDWSARDLQKWEYQPLGPFLAKNFLTSVSPWVVTTQALAPFRTAAFARPDGDPAPLPHLHDEADQAAGGVDMVLEAWLLTPAMREAGHEAVRLSRGNFKHMYWTPAQMIAHHSSSGCNMRPGDLLASGTVSGPDKGSRGCLLELSWRGTEPIQLPGGEERKFLQDGDELALRGHCEAPGAVRIGLGEVTGRVLPAGGGR